LIGGFLLVLPQFLFPLEEKQFVWTFGYSFLYLGYGAILVSLMCSVGSSDPWQGFFESLPAHTLAWVGVYSYSIYLWHIFIVFVVGRLFTRGAFGFLPTVAQWLTVTLLLTFGSILIGVLLGKLVEIPALAVRDRFFPRRAAALQQD
jgi:peptidoglycan/LPS O-acetylase OafA/YrhL